MITCVTYDNLEQTAKAFCSQFELRHSCFIERQSYDVFSYEGKEYDQYDNPSSVYLVYQGQNGQALGASRLTPVRHRSMVHDLWPDMVSKRRYAQHREVWEGTRFCIDKNLSPELRRIIVFQLVLAYIEFGIDRGIDSIIGIMHTVILKRVFRDSGVTYTLLGPEKNIDGLRIQAAEMDINLQQLLNVRAVTGISKPVIANFFDKNQRVMSPKAA